MNLTATYFFPEEYPTPLTQDEIIEILDQAKPPHWHEAIQVRHKAVNEARMVCFERLDKAFDKRKREFYCVTSPVCESYWELRRLTDNGVQLSGAGYDNNSAIEVQKCIPKNCYTFTLFDSFGDGLCCTHGMGSFSVKIDDDTLILNGGNFSYEDPISFGDCTENAGKSVKPIA